MGEIVYKLADTFGLVGKLVEMCGRCKKAILMVERINLSVGARRGDVAAVAKIAAAYVACNHVTIGEIPDLIRSINTSLMDAEHPKDLVAMSLSKPTAAQIKSSITPDGLISFIDGRPYKILRRHVSAHNLTFEQYKTCFGLPPGYPATAPNYSATRSALATATNKRLLEMAAGPVPNPTHEPEARPLVMDSVAVE